MLRAASLRNPNSFQHGLGAHIFNSLSAPLRSSYVPYSTSVTSTSRPSVSALRLSHTSTPPTTTHTHTRASSSNPSSIEFATLAFSMAHHPITTLLYPTKCALQHTQTLPPSSMMEGDGVVMLGMLGGDVIAIGEPPIARESTLTPTHARCHALCVGWLDPILRSHEASSSGGGLFRSLPCLACTHVGPSGVGSLSIASGRAESRDLGCCSVGALMSLHYRPLVARPSCVNGEAGEPCTESTTAKGVKPPADRSASCGGVGRAGQSAEPCHDTCAVSDPSDRAKSVGGSEVESPSYPPFSPSGGLQVPLSRGVCVVVPLHASVEQLVHGKGGALDLLHHPTELGMQTTGTVAGSSHRAGSSLVPSPLGVGSPEPMGGVMGWLEHRSATRLFPWVNSPIAVCVRLRGVAAASLKGRPLWFAPHVFGIFGYRAVQQTETINISYSTTSWWPAGTTSEFEGRLGWVTEDNTTPGGWYVEVPRSTSCSLDEDDSMAKTLVRLCAGLGLETSQTPPQGRGLEISSNSLSCSTEGCLECIRMDTGVCGLAACTAWLSAEDDLTVYSAMDVDRCILFGSLRHGGWRFERVSSASSRFAIEGWIQSWLT